jgi:hypothetical protein
MMGAGQIVELPGGWLGGKRQLGLGQARERGTSGAQGEHADGSLFDGSLFDEL